MEDIKFEWVDKEHFIFKAIIARKHKKAPINIFLKFYDDCCSPYCPLSREISDPIDGKLKGACVICRIKLSNFGTFCNLCRALSEKHYEDKLLELCFNNPLLDDFNIYNIGPVYHKYQWGCIKRYMINNDNT